MKEKIQLNFVHRLLGLGLIFVGILIFLQPNAYHAGFQYGKEGIGFSFLQEGTYTVDVYCEDAGVPNSLIIYTDNLIDENNQPGVEFLQADIAQGEEKTRVTLELKQDVYFLNFRTEQDSLEKSYIDRVVIQGAQLQNRDHYLLGLLCILSAISILFFGKFVSEDKYKEPVMLVVFGLLASMPLFSDFVLGGDDLGFHVARIEAVYQGLKAGEFPVYLGSNQMGGFGMLSGTMYPQLFLYPFAFLRFFGVSLMLCYKLLVVAMNIGSAVTSYYSAKYMCKSSSIGFWTSLFFTFSIYRLTNIYSRAALGEALAMVFLPLVIWGIYEVLWGEHKKWYLLALGVGGVLQSHVLSAEMCVMFLVLELLVWLISTKKSCFVQRVLAGIKAAGLTIGVNAFFLYPFLCFCGEDLQCFSMPNQIGETVVYFSQMFSLFAPAEGKDMVLGSTTGEMAHTVGTVLLIGAVLLCIEAFRQKEKCEEMQVGKRCLVYGVIALLLSSWLFPWERIQSIEWLYTIVTSIQFAWRFFSPASILLSIAAAVGVVSYAKEAKDKWVYALCAVLVVCSTGYYFDMKGHEGTAYSDKMFFNGYGYTDAMYMYSDGESFKALNLQYNRSDAYVKMWYDTEVEYSEFQREGMKLSVIIDAPEDVQDYVVLPFYYYPGYQVTLNGVEVETINLDSLLACELQGGRTELVVRYKGIQGAGIANIVSLLSIIGVLIYLVYYSRRSKVEVKKNGL